MREALVILLVLVLLLALTAVRYRKQIAGVLGIARMLRDAKRAASGMQQNLPQEGGKAVQLVSCAKCGVWVPQAKARKVGEIYFCSSTCHTDSKVSA
jgi:hypothetical protein